MRLVAAIRPDDVNLPLFLHVLGAMLLVGTLFTVALAVLLAWRRPEPAESDGLYRFGLRTLLLGVVPSYLLMRTAGQITEGQLDLPEELDSPRWLQIGYITTELGLLLIVISIVLSAIGLRRARRGGGQGAARAVGVMSVVLLAAYVVAVWAMSVKPD